MFPLDELKLQPKGGRGLTLVDLEPKDALVSVAAFSTALQVLGTSPRGKARDETLKGASLAAYAGKRARKGKPVEGLKQGAAGAIGRLIGRTIALSEPTSGARSAGRAARHQHERRHADQREQRQAPVLEGHAEQATPRRRRRRR